MYQYYADKDELVNAVFDRMMETNKAECISCSQRGENAIHEVFMSFDMVEELLSNMNPSVLFDMQKYHPKAFKKFLDFKNNFLYRLIKENLASGINDQIYRDDIDIDILTRFRIHTVMLSLDPDVFPSNKSSLVHIEQQLLEHFLYGLATPKGQKLIQKYKNQRIKNQMR